MSKENTRLVFAIKAKQISHGDLKVKNILCLPEGPMFIDLDSMQAGQSYTGFSRQFKKDIQRFQISWPLKWKGKSLFRKLFT